MHSKPRWLAPVHVHEPRARAGDPVWGWFVRPSILSGDGHIIARRRRTCGQPLDSTANGRLGCFEEAATCCPRGGHKPHLSVRQQPSYARGRLAIHLGAGRRHPFCALGGHTTQRRRRGNDPQGRTELQGEVGVAFQSAPGGGATTPTTATDVYTRIVGVSGTCAPPTDAPPFPARRPPDGWQPTLRAAGIIRYGAVRGIVNLRNVQGGRTPLFTATPPWQHRRPRPRLGCVDPRLRRRPPAPRQLRRFRSRSEASASISMGGQQEWSLRAWCRRPRCRQEALGSRQRPGPPLAVPQPPLACAWRCWRAGRRGEVGAVVHAGSSWLS